MAKRKRILNKVVTTNEVSAYINEYSRKYPSHRYDVELTRTIWGETWIIVVWDRGE